MRSKLLFLAAALFLVNCATYKQLKPKPALENGEQGYIELLNNKNPFKLNLDKKYFISFPAPQNDHFYLILKSPLLPKLQGSLTGDLQKKSVPGPKIADETYAPDSMSIFPVDKSKAGYFWLIDKVPEKKLPLTLKYRYAPQWRVKFEHSYSSYKQTLAKNRVDRDVYNTIGVTLHLEGFNYPLVMDSVSRHSVELKKVQKELRDLESIFPQSILNSTDPAYLNYKKLKKDLDEEIDFQANYYSVLGFFYREFQTRSNNFTFLGYVEDFIAYFSMKNNLPDHIVTESRNLLEKRLNEVPSFFDQRLQTKDDAAPLDTAYFRSGALARIVPLYSASGLKITPEFQAVIKFMNDFDAKGKALVSLRDSLDKIVKYVKDGPAMPGNEFFKGVNARIGALQNAVPAGIDQSYGKYQGFPCAQKLNGAIGDVNTTLLKLVAQYRDAENIVTQLNILKLNRDFSAMIGILKQNQPLGFLLDKYRDLDKMSIDEQSKNIRQALDNSSWGAGESALRKLSADQNFLDPAMLAVKAAAVRDYEDTLYARVDRVTRAKVNKFCEDNATTYTNIDSLYADSVFLPAYDITFSSEGRKDLTARKELLVADLAKLKTNEFPAKSIKLLYDDFVKSSDQNGVLKARAIVAHSKHFLGDTTSDKGKKETKETKIRISEADPLVAKWITEPKTYRRVFVVPVSDNARGKNKYVVRFNVNIKTEAQFPVYDLNIKLPKEVAQNAATTQWYESISCNKSELKNEGRFSITAPTAANDYECQISPVQMNKDKTNVLEIVFNYPAYKVLQVSVMVQKPIIKKN